MPRTAQDSTAKLLPSSSTKLELDLAKLMPFDSVLRPMAEKITSAKLIDMPESWLPWLIVEYGLTELGEFFTDQRTLIEEGLKLRTLRGTPAAAELALGWLGYPDAQVWEESESTVHFAEWQIDTGKVVRDIEDLCRIARIARIIQPARSRLRRVYHGHDIRQFRLDNSGWGNLLSHYSGVWVDEVAPCTRTKTGLWASFSGQYQLLTTGPAAVVLAQYERWNDYTGWVRPPAYPILDDDYEDSFYPNVGVVGMGRDSEIAAGDAIAYPRWAALSRESGSVRDMASIRVHHFSESVGAGATLADDGGSVLADDGTVELTD